MGRISFSGTPQGADSVIGVTPAIGLPSVDKFGQNPDVDAFTGAAEDIIYYGGDQYFPASEIPAASIDISSDSGNDTGAGTGAQSITIQGIAYAGWLQSETVILDGANPVNPIGNYWRIFRAAAEDVGATGTNEGNITIANGANVFAYIPQDLGQTLQAAYTVPMDYEYGWLQSIEVSVNNKTAVSITAALQTRAFGKGWLTKRTFEVSNLAPYQYPWTNPQPYPPRTDIRLRVLSASTDNLSISGTFEMLLR